MRSTGCVGSRASPTVLCENLMLPAHVAPIATMAGPDIGPDGPFRVALSSSRNVGVTNRNSVTEYAEGTNGDAAPIATISGTW